MRTLIALAAALAAGCSPHSAPTAPEELPPARVRTATVAGATVPLAQEVAGTVRPAERAVVSAKVMGTVRSLRAELGRPVRAGETIATLAAAELEARVAQARASLDQARRDFERESGLLGSGVSTADAVRTLQDRVRIAEAALAEAETVLSYTSVTAPFDGVIARRFVNEGDLATPGLPLVEVEGVGRLQAEVEVPEGLPLLERGASVALRSGDHRLTGTIAEISPASDPSSRTRLAKVDVPAGAPVLSGQFVRVRWPAGQSTSLRVPAEAVSRIGQMERILVVQDGRARMRLVRTAAAEGGWVDILSGAVAGETVVLGDAPAVRDGQRVEVSP